MSGLPVESAYRCSACGNEVVPQLVWNGATRFVGVVIIEIVLLVCLYLLGFSGLFLGVLVLVMIGIALMKAPSRVRVCPSCGTQMGLSRTQAGQPVDRVEEKTLTTTSQRLEKPCPWCAEPILKEAKVCKHCRRPVEQ